MFLIFVQLIPFSLLFHRTGRGGCCRSASSIIRFDSLDRRYLSRIDPCLISLCHLYPSIRDLYPSIIIIVAPVLSSTLDSFHIISPLQAFLLIIDSERASRLR